MYVHDREANISMIMLISRLNMNSLREHAHTALEERQMLNLILAESSIEKMPSQLVMQASVIAHARLRPDEL